MKTQNNFCKTQEPAPKKRGALDHTNAQRASAGRTSCAQKPILSSNAMSKVSQRRCSQNAAKSAL
jgi:hypothetical protein